MKRMNKFVLMLMYSLWVLSACGGDSPEPDKVTLLGSYVSGTVEADGDGDSFSVSFAANREWTATSDQAWCRVSPSSGVGSETANVKVSVDRNEAAQSRTAKITWTVGTASATLVVTQEKGSLNAGGTTEDMKNKEW